jgi:transcriptional regulator with XRE-family HTH domain
MTTQPEPAGVAIDGPEIRRRRKLRGWTVTQLAERASISQQYMSFIERGARDRVSPPVFNRICDAFDLDEASRVELMREGNAA